MTPRPVPVRSGLWDPLAQPPAYPVAQIWRRTLAISRGIWTAVIGVAAAAVLLQLGGASAFASPRVNDVGHEPQGGLNDPPTAVLFVSQVPTPPLTVFADGSGSTDPDAYPIATCTFDFGDGSPPITVRRTGDGLIPVTAHTYLSPGTYTITLVATDTGNLASVPVSATLTVQPDLPPVVTLAASQLATPPLTVSADATGSTDTDLTPIATYHFDFGDGTPVVDVAAPATTAQHAYATAGSYTITLTATDAGSITSTPVTTTLTVQPELAPVAHLAASQLATPPLTVSADATGSVDGDLTPIASYHFDFGDGTPVVNTTAPTVVAQHAYATAGTYTITLTATDTGNNTSSPVSTTLAVQPELPPAASLAVTQPATPALTVNADASGSTDGDLTPIASYHFDFGDGTPVVNTTAPTATTQHTYAAAGSHTVTVTVTDTGNNTSAPASVTLNVQAELPPAASLIVTQPATPALTVNANASGSTDTDLTPIASYHFDFGDGTPIVNTTAPTATAQHTYAAAGSHTVTVTVTDTGNNTSAPASVTLNVQAELPPAASLTVTQPATPALTVNADASGSTDGDLTPIASYHFDFGDGSPVVNTTAPTGTAQHTYAAAGSHTVTVTVTDTGNNTSAPASVTLNVQAELPPVASLTVTQPATPALTVNADASGSTDGDLTPIASYHFDFGDGTPVVNTTAPTATTQHAYAAAGSHTVTVTVTDTGNNTSAPTSVTLNVQAELPPAASLTVIQPATPALTVNANASGSTDTDLTPIASYHFDFGDGTPIVNTTAPTATAQHAYAAAGSHTVTVTVTDTGNNTSAPASVTLNVQAELPPAASLTVTQPATPALTVNANASGSTDTDLTPIASYHFDFGDGTPIVNTTAPTATAQHTYATAGSHTVTVTVTDTGNNTSAPASVTLNVQAELPPAASLAVSQLASPALTVNANASGSTDTDLTPIASYHFDFGDGTPIVNTTAPAATAQHTYAAGGNRTITLTVTDTGNNTSTPVTATLNVIPPEQPPVARLSLTQLASPAFTMRADASASTDVDATPIATYHFDFGDGTPIVNTSAPTAIAQHTYASAGTYTVTLTATDTGNSTSTPTTGVANVTAPLTPIILERQVQASTDDAEEFADGTMYLDSSDLELIHDTSDQTVGMRWTGLAVPPGSTITAAYIQFDAKESQSEATNLTLRAQAADNPTTFTNIAHDITNRPRTTAATNWTPAPWTVGDQGPDQRCPDLSAPIQEVVSRPGWASGNSLIVIVNGTGHRTAWAYDGNASEAPILHVEFLTPESPPVASLTLAQPPTPALTVNADASGSTDTDGTPITSYHFNFGDGSPVVTTYAPTASAQHTYAAAGNRTVTLTVTDSGNNTSAPLNKTINVQAEFPPVANLVVNQLSSPALTVSADGSGSTDTDLTPIASYHFNFGDGTPVVNTTAPTATAQHTYASAGTYTITLTVTDTGNNTSTPANVQKNVTSSQVAVYVGYYDTHHAVNTQPKPNPWRGSPSTVFIGTQDNKAGDPPGGGWDTSCIRIDNLTGSTLTGVVVSADIGSEHFALWGTNSIPAGQHLVLAQTAFENFDGSDLNPAGCYGCDPAQCVTLKTSIVPVVHVTIGGAATTDYPDPGQYLNTHGADAAGCPYVGGPLPQTRYDESENWVQVTPAGSSPYQSSGAPPFGTVSDWGHVLALAPPAPNPARGDLTVRFATPERGPVHIALFDLQGRLVRPFIDNVLDAATYSFHVRLEGVFPGIYFVRLWTPQGARTHKLVLMH